jgi:hypothetical protein
VVCTRCVKHDCKSLPQSSRPLKSRWYKARYIVPTYTLFAWVDSPSHASSLPSTTFASYSFPTTTADLPPQTTSAPLVGAHPFESSSTTAGCVTGEYETRIDKEKNKEGHSRHTAISIIEHLDR